MLLLLLVSIGSYNTGLNSWSVSGLISRDHSKTKSLA